MDGIWLRLTLFLFDLVLPICAGFVLVRMGRVTERRLDWLMESALIGVLPITAGLSIWILELQWQLIWLPVLGLVMQLIPGAVGLSRARTKGQNSLEKGSYLLSSILSNRGLVGGLSVFILFGEEGFALSRLVLMLGLPVLFIFCFPMARYFHAAHHGRTTDSPTILSTLLDRRQMPLVGFAIGLSLNFGGIERPETLGYVFQILIHVVAWCFLMHIGGSINFTEIRGYMGQVADLVAIKFLLNPLVTLALGWAVGLDAPVLAVTVMLACCPTAINAVIASKLHKLNVHVAMAAFLLTTAVYVFVVFPLILLVSMFLNGGS